MMRACARVGAIVVVAWALLLPVALVHDFWVAGDEPRYLIFYWCGVTLFLLVVGGVVTLAVTIAVELWKT